MSLLKEAIGIGSVVIEVRDRKGGVEHDRAELKTALRRRPREIPSKLFYDERGSALFERITELPEYYPTRTERALLERVADRVVAASGARQLVEIGSGAATKTRILLDAMERQKRLQLYVPFDVAEGTLRRSAEELVAEYPGLSVHGVVGDFTAQLGQIPEGENRLVVFLGSTIGNLGPEGVRRFLADLARAMAPGDHFLLGVDLIKDVARLEAAYNDDAGVTAEFNRNILRAVNRLTGGDFDPEAFRHQAPYQVDLHRIEMWLVALARQVVHLPALGMEIQLDEGEGIRTEISTKYDRPQIETLLAANGLTPLGWYTDPERLFGLSLSRKG
ncbi:MAG TPA: L-histidine N(alpha)-methyltransferase [Thermoanaerobaculia bacterium]|nr:L-histidine N(alpha)-methyltransferase [Thermoanaerobaculia bacterium]